MSKSGDAHLRPIGALLCVLALSLAPGSPHAGPTPTTARGSLGVAEAAARAWAADAELVVIENDEPLDGSGRSARWGYLFRSPSLGRSRAWSVREGRIVTAENLEARFDAPPLDPGWLDSDAIVAAMRSPSAKPAGRLVTLLLMRGREPGEPADATTWTFVHEGGGAGSLFVVVHAGTGKVQRSWRG